VLDKHLFNSQIANAVVFVAISRRTGATKSVLCYKNSDKTAAEQRAFLLFFFCRIARGLVFLRYTALGSLIIPGKNSENSGNSHGPIFARGTQAVILGSPGVRAKLDLNRSSAASAGAILQDPVGNRFQDPPFQWAPNDGISVRFAPLERSSAAPTGLQSICRKRSPDLDVI
jgi:hypothetical protein